MDPQHHISFGPFRLDTAAECLWRDDQPIRLQPKAMAVLRYMAQNPGRLITQAEFLDQVWPGTHVDRGGLRVRIREIRVALGDQARAPRYIETVGQQGYRFLGGPAIREPSLVHAESPIHRAPTVGRQMEMAHLQHALRRAINGDRQLRLISGEAGIGKTTLVDLFWSRVAGQSGARIARGQCIEHYGEGEPYLPLLESLGRLCRDADGDRVRDGLRRHAPMWLIQMPALLSDAELETLRRRIQGMTRAQMLRELAEALEVLTADTPLILVLEDIHWGDASTLEWIAYMAQRRDPCRLLTLITYRPEELRKGHLLRRLLQDVKGRRLGEELRLGSLTETDVTSFLAGRLGQGASSPELARGMHQLSAGHALFLVNIVEHLITRRYLIYTDAQWRVQGKVTDLLREIPEGLGQVITGANRGAHP